MRVKFIRDYKYWKTGDIALVSRTVGYALIAGGLAINAKDMTARDYQTKGQKR
jgi:hypothetical protein